MKIYSFIMLGFTLAFRNVVRNPRRSLLTSSAIAVALLSANMLTAFQNGMLDQMLEDTINNFTGHIQLHNTAYLDDPVALNSFTPPSKKLEEMRRVGKIVDWSSRVRVPAVIRSERESAGLSFLGVYPEKTKNLTFFGSAPINGRFLSSSEDSGLVIGERLADFLQTGLGKRVVISTQDSDGRAAERGFRIVGLYKAQIEANEKAYALTGIDTAKKLLRVHREPDVRGVNPH